MGNKKKGSIAISLEEIENNRMGWDVNDFFKFYLRKYTDDVCAGWYARKLQNNLWIYYWVDSGFELPGKYLKALQNDGWEISNDLSTTI
jgi:hypothetical protein